MVDAEAVEIPPGIVCVVCGDMSRYTNFAAALVPTIVDLHEESALMWSVGPTVADNANDGATALLVNDRADWLWILGDDHHWPRELLPVMLYRMYETDLDVLVPLCMQRSWPPNYVVYDRFEDGVAKIVKPQTIADILASGDWTREVVAAGNAGMLIRKRVFQGMKMPFFRNVLRGPEGDDISQGGEDLNFCTDVREAGFKIHCSYDLPLGHITQVTLYPEWAHGHLGMRMIFGAEDGPFVQLAKVEEPTPEPSRVILP